jgi:ABC-type multidrug transport system fused ATPase/permease subunit
MGVGGFDLIWAGVGMAFIAVPPFLIAFIPFWGRLRIKRGLAFAACSAVVVFGVLVFCLLSVNNLSFEFHQLWKLVMVVPTLILCLLFIDEKKTKLLYFCAVIAALLLAVIKTGNFITVNLFSDINYLNMAVVYGVFHAIITPPLIKYIKWLIAKTSSVAESSDNKIWKIIWVLPTLFLVTNIMTNISFNPEVTATPAFLISVFLAVIGVIASSSVLIRAMQMVSETTRQKEAADFYRKMSHNLRTPLTRVSTSIQVVMDHPEMADELLPDAQADIMGMSKMIGDALDGGDVDGGGK